MPLRRAALAVLPAAIPLLVTAAPAAAATPRVTLTLSRHVIVNYVSHCTEGQLSWSGQGSGVAKVVMRQYTPSGERAGVPDSLPPGGRAIGGFSCASVANFGRWKVTVTAYSRSGHVLAKRTATYLEKGNTEIREFNASPEPVRKGHKITVRGRLLHVKFGHAPWYVSYHGKRIHIYFRRSGSKTWHSAGSATTGRDGRFRVRFTAHRSGNWRASFSGTSKFDAETSHGDFVKVR